MSQVTPTAKKIIANIEKVVIGKRQEIILALVAYLSEGHILLEDVPGVAKTMLARALAAASAASFKRVQCTPDLLPTDITGASIFNPKTTEFEFRPGPIFAQIVLADEINRATPRTQAALLEAMAERRVTGRRHDVSSRAAVPGHRHAEPDRPRRDLPASRSPARPVPGAAQPGLSQRRGRRQDARACCGTSIRSTSSRAVVSADDVIACQQAVRDVHVDPKVRDYIVEIVRNTREHDDIALGGSPRASLALCRAAQALAAIRGHDFVLARRRQAAGRRRPRSPAHREPGEPAAQGHARSTSSTKSGRDVGAHAVVRAERVIGTDFA